MAIACQFGVGPAWESGFAALPICPMPRSANLSMSASNGTVGIIGKIEKLYFLSGINDLGQK
jgi:hypothetical protein